MAQACVFVCVCFCVCVCARACVHTHGDLAALRLLLVSDPTDTMEDRPTLWWEGRVPSAPPLPNMNLLVAALMTLCDTHTHTHTHICKMKKLSHPFSCLCFVYVCGVGSRTRRMLVRLIRFPCLCVSVCVYTQPYLQLHLFP